MLNEPRQFSTSSPSRIKPPRPIRPRVAPLPPFGLEHIPPRMHQNLSLVCAPDQTPAPPSLEPLSREARTLHPDSCDLSLGPSGHSAMECGFFCLLTWRSCRATQERLSPTCHCSPSQPITAPCT